MKKQGNKALPHPEKLEKSLTLTSSPKASQKLGALSGFHAQNRLLVQSDLESLGFIEIPNHQPLAIELAS